MGLRIIKKGTSHKSAELCNQNLAEGQRDLDRTRNLLPLHEELVRVRLPGRLPHGRAIFLEDTDLAAP